MKWLVLALVLGGCADMTPQEDDDMLNVLLRAATAVIQVVIQPAP